MASVTGPSEAQLKSAFLLAAPVALPNLRLFVRDVGAARMRGGHVVRFGVKGQCDLWGLTRQSLHIELELKRHDGRLSPDQLRWSEWCATWGVRWVLLKA
jgi:hypothetical protein